MPKSVLATKLFIPTVREELVQRPALMQRLNEGLNRKMSLICAPAGYGKTTLVAQWMRNLVGLHGDSHSPCLAWLSLDTGDGDPGRFLTHLIAALKGVVDTSGLFGEEALAMLQTLEFESTETLLGSLINDLTETMRPVVVVLEDYHLIDSSRVDQAVTFLVDHMPQSLHLVVTSRSDPSLPLSRMRARGELSELRAEDLRFSIHETSVFLNLVMKLDLDEQNVVALAHRTEGWVAGLQLTALSVRQSDDVDRFVRSFTGSSRFIMDYLLEEVLGRQPEKLQQFLLQTSILERMTGSLCDALTGRNDGQSVLESLERDNLFLTSLDDERHWYRYHHLFATLLQQRLAQSPDVRIANLHRRAGEWYERHGLVTEALPHVFATGDAQWAGRIVEEVGDTTIWQHIDIVLLRHWIESLPDDLVRSRPQLSILAAWEKYASGHVGQVESYLRSAQSASIGAEDDEAPEAALQVHVMTLRGMLATLDGDLPRAIGLLGEANSLASSVSSPLEAVSPFWLAEAHFMNGDLQMSERLYRAAERAAWRRENHYIAAMSARGIGRTQALRGSLHEALETYRELERRLQTRHITSPFAQGVLDVGIGEILCEWNELERAVATLREGIEHARRAARPLPLLHGYVALARALRGLGDLGGARLAIEECLAAWDRFRVHSMWPIPHGPACRAHFLLASGDVTAARAWAEQDTLLEGPLSVLSESHYLTNVRLLLAEGKPDNALKLLTHLLEFTKRSGRASSEIEVELLQALALDSLGRLDEAVEALRHALGLAEPGGFVRIFIEEGPPMARLLYELASRGLATDYVRRLLAAFPPTESEEAERPQVEAANSELFEPLSERELDVLRLIAQGLSNQEIGEKLFISLHTVKSHARNLFAKLNTRSRTAAVNKARGLGLLPPL